MLLLALPLPAPAACALCTCTASATGVAFGRYNSLSGASVEDTGDVRISCGGDVGTVAYAIQLNRGIYSTGFSPRQMGSGSSRLNYDLYTSPAHVTIWGDSSSATGFISDSLSVMLGGSSRDYIMYGRIPARQISAAAGGYSDIITVTVIYQ